MLDQETLKHAGDNVIIPSGLGVIIANYIGMANEILTFLVLLTSLIWGVIRIIDMRNKQRRKKR